MTRFTPIKDRIEYGGAMIGLEEVKAVMDVVLGQGGKRWTVGPQSEAFEKELAEKVGVKGAVFVNSGSSALLLAIAALKLPKGSKVIIPALNFPTAYSSILQNQLIPVVVDCGANFNISLDSVKQALKEHPDVKAIVAIHIAGNCVDLPKLREIVGERVIISDNCDGLGGTLHGKYIDTYADISCVSFHAAHIITTGEGGAVLSNNEDYLERVRKMREWGRASGSDQLTKHEDFPIDYRERYVFEEMGYNLKPLELQAALGRVQLTKLETFKQKRLENYSLIYDAVKQSKSVKAIVGGLDNCWFSFPMLAFYRQAVMDILEQNNIETRTVFSGNILKHPAYKNEPHIQIGDLAMSNHVMESGLFISVHPYLTSDMLEFMCYVLKRL